MCVCVHGRGIPGIVYVSTTHMSIINQLIKMNEWVNVHDDYTVVWCLVQINSLHQATSHSGEKVTIQATETVSSVLSFSHSAHKHALSCYPFA